MSRSGKVYTLNELNNDVFKSGNLELNKFDASYLQNQERYYIKESNGNPIVFNTDEVTLSFDTKLSPKPENVSWKPKDKLEFTVKVPRDSTFYQVFGDKFKQIVLDWVYQNKDNISILNIESTEQDDIKEELEHMYKPPIYGKPEYPPNFSCRVEEFPKEGLNFSSIIIKEDGSYVNDITDVIEDDEIKLFKRGTTIKCIIMLNYLTIREDSIRANFKVHKVKITGKSSGAQVNYVNVNNPDEIDSVNIMPPIKAGDKGGKKSYYNIKGGQGGFDLSSENGVIPKDWPIENIDKNTGNPYYSLCIPITQGSEQFNFFTKFDERVCNILTENSKEYTGKKLSKKLTLKKLKSILKYSKEDLDKIKNGEDPQYDPLLVINLSKYDDKFTFEFLDVDGNKLQPNELIQYHLSHSGCSYNIKCKIQHLWYGTKFSTKLVLTSIQIVNEIQSAVAFSFDDEPANSVNDGPEDDDDEHNSSDDEQNSSGDDNDASDDGDDDDDDDEE